MADADQTPVCIDTEGDLELKKLMLENHDVPAHITPAGRNADAGLWVASADVDREGFDQTDGIHRGESGIRILAMRVRRTG